MENPASNRLKDLFEDSDLFETPEAGRILEVQAPIRGKPTAAKKPGVPPVPSDLFSDIPPIKRKEEKEIRIEKPQQEAKPTVQPPVTVTLRAKLANGVVPVIEECDQSVLPAPKEPNPFDFKTFVKSSQPQGSSSAPGVLPRAPAPPPPDAVPPPPAPAPVPPPPSAATSPPPVRSMPPAPTLPTTGAILPPAAASVESKSDTAATIAALKAEILALQERVAKAEARALEAEQNLKQYKKKEAKEAQALEEILQGVEHNLALATSRADKAEAKVRELQAEIEKLRQHPQDRNTERNQLSDQLETQLKAVTLRNIAYAKRLQELAEGAEREAKALSAGAASLRELATYIEHSKSLHPQPS